jgi:hypothetical protein
MGDLGIGGKVPTVDPLKLKTLDKTEKAKTGDPEKPPEAPPSIKPKDETLVDGKLKDLKTFESGKTDVKFDTAKKDAAALIDASSLSPDQKEMAKKVLSSLNPDQVDHFKELLNKGTLTKKDSEGVTVLERLNKMVSEERNQGLKDNKIDGKTIMNQTVEMLADPLKIQQGNDKGTCAACTLNYILARNEPAELTRLIEGITSKDGRVRLKNGEEMKLNKTSLADDKSGRTDAQRLIQSSIMDKGAFMGFDYDNTKDHDSAWGFIHGDSRMTIGNQAGVYSAITGRPMDSPTSFMWGEEDVAARIQAATGKGEDIPVIMSWGGKFGYHFLTVHEVKYDDAGKPKSVIMRNPWGEDGGDGAPPRKALGGGLIEMDWSEFVKRIDGAVIPQDIANKPFDSAKMPVQSRIDAINTLCNGYTNGKEEATIKDILVSSTPEDLSAIMDKIPPGKLVSELDDGDVAAVMKKLAEGAGVGNNGKHLANLMAKSDDDVARAFLEKMSDADLKKLAATPDGRQALKNARKNLDDGWTTDNEYRQINRLDKILAETMNDGEKSDRIKSLMKGYTNGTDERAIKNILLTASPQDLSNILDKVNLGDLASELDDGDLADVMKRLAENSATGNNARHLRTLMGKTDDDVAMAFLHRMNDQQIKQLATTPDGKEALKLAWKHLDSGWTTGSEEDQMKRIEKLTGIKG